MTVLEPDDHFHFIYGFLIHPSGMMIEPEKQEHFYHGNLQTGK